MNHKTCDIDGSLFLKMGQMIIFYFIQRDLSCSRDQKKKDRDWVSHLKREVNTPGEKRSSGPVSCYADESYRLSGIVKSCLCSQSNDFWRHMKTLGNRKSPTLVYYMKWQSQ